jgi:hypothetical protein
MRRQNEVAKALNSFDHENKGLKEAKAVSR